MVGIMLVAEGGTNSVEPHVKPEERVQQDQ